MECGVTLWHFVVTPGLLLAPTDAQRPDGCQGQCVRSVVGIVASSMGKRRISHGRSGVACLKGATRKSAATETMRLSSMGRSSDRP
jgi:hypothetical protein